MSETNVVPNATHVYQSTLTVDEMRSAIAGLYMAELGDEPQQKLDAVLAHNKAVNEEITALNEAVKGEKDAVRRMILEAGVKSLVAEKTATILTVPTLEQIAAGMLKAKVDSVFEAMKLVEAKVKTRNTAGGDLGKFQNRWSVELKVNGGVFAVEHRVLTDAQKAKYDVKNPGQWVLAKGDKRVTVSATSPNQLIQAAKLFLGQSTNSPINNDAFNNGSNMSAEAIAVI